MVNSGEKDTDETTRDRSKMLDREGSIIGFSNFVYDL